MVDFAPGMRTIIRDEEWMVKKIETNSLGNKALYCIGISPLVKDKETIFLTDLECQTAHCGRCEQHFIVGAFTSPTVRFGR